MAGSLTERLICGLWLCIWQMIVPSNHYGALITRKLQRKPASGRPPLHGSLCLGTEAPTKSRWIRPGKLIQSRAVTESNHTRSRSRPGWCAPPLLPPASESHHLQSHEPPHYWPLPNTNTRPVLWSTSSPCTCTHSLTMQRPLFPLWWYVRARAGVTGTVAAAVGWRRVVEPQRPRPYRHHGAAARSCPAPRQRR